MMVLAVLLSATSGSTSEGWRASHGDGYCSVDRENAVSADNVEIISISQDVIFNTIRANISSPASGPGWQTRGQPTFDTIAGPTPFTSPHYSAKRMADGRYLIEVVLSKESSDSATIFNLGLKTKDGRQKISDDGLEAAQSLLDACRQIYLNELGIDPAEVDASLTAAIPSPKPNVWFDASDLPKTRVKPNLYKPFVIWRVEPDGHASR